MSETPGLEILDQLDQRVRMIHPPEHVGKTGKIFSMQRTERDGWMYNIILDEPIVRDGRKYYYIPLVLRDCFEVVK